MTSEIRTNSLKSRAGLSTVTLTDSGPMFSGITTFVDNSTFSVGTGGTIHAPATNVMALGTNSIDAIKIDSSGNVNISGILTASSISGGVSLSNGSNNRVVTATGAAALTGEANLTFDGSNTLAITGPEGGAARIDLIADQGDDAGDKWRITNTSGNDFKIQRTTSHTDALVIFSNGTVGINTSATNRILTINDTLGGGIGVQGSNAGIFMGTHATDGFQKNAAIARAAATNYHINGSAAGDLCIASESTKDIIFGTGASVGAMAERLRISSTGIIYIGPDGTGGRLSASGGNLSITDGNGRQTLRIDDPGSGNTHTHVFDSGGRLQIGASNNTGSNTKLVVGFGNNINTTCLINTGDVDTDALTLSNWDGSTTTSKVMMHFDSSGIGGFNIGMPAATDAFIIEDDGGAEYIRVNNTGITTFFNVPTLDNTPTTGHNSILGTHGFSVQRSFIRNVTAGNVANFADYRVTEGNIAIMIQISSDTGGNSGTATYYWYGGFLPSSGYGDHWHRIFPAHVGYGHGNGADTGIGNSTAWELLIGGSGITGDSYRIRVACHIPSGQVTKNIAMTITELRRGMTFYDKSSDALYAFSGQTDSGSDAINKMWSNSFVVSNSSDSTNYNYREIYLSGNQHLYFANGANQAYLHLNGSWQNASDLAYKKDIEDITYGIDTVKQLKPRKYKHKGTNDDDIGFIAQELESVIPEIVGGDEGNKGISYGNLTSVLTKAIQELTTKVEKLEQENIALRASVKDLASLQNYYPRGD